MDSNFDPYFLFKILEKKALERNLTLEKYLIIHHKNNDGKFYLHAFVEFNQKLRNRSCTFFDFFINDRWILSRFKSVKASKKDILQLNAYLQTKPDLNYITNINFLELKNKSYKIAQPQKMNANFEKNVDNVEKIQPNPHTSVSKKIVAIKTVEELKEEKRLKAKRKCFEKFEKEQ